MAKKVNIADQQSKRVRVVDKPPRRIEPAELAEALGAESGGEHIGANLDLISLAELGTKLQGRLRSSGGRPGLAGATDFCRVPLSTEDVKALEKITAEIEERSGLKPSLGQVVSIIVHDYLQSDAANSAESDDMVSKPNPSMSPHLAEIASKASALQKCANDLETAVKQIKDEMEKWGA
jgi:hypothetical protein